MNRFEVLITRRVPPSALNIIKERCNVDLWESEDAIPRKELLEKVEGKSGILCLLTDNIDQELLEIAGQDLRVVSTMSVGVDHIDVEECRKRRIALGHTPYILTNATAELAVGLLLATTRRIVEGTRAVKNGSWGSWKGMWMCGSTLDGSTVGFFGLGRIGLAILDRLRPFGVKSFLYNTSTKKSDDFEQRHQVEWVSFGGLLARSDFVIVCCSLNQQTSGIFDRSSFKKMKSTSIFINVSRGAVVQQDDLVASLQCGDIRAAGVDVTTPEPLPVDHPLLELDNCVVTPHIGSATESTRIKMAELAAKNLVCGLQGTPMPAPFHTPPSSGCG